MEETETEAYVPIEDVAKKFSVANVTVRKWIREGILPPSTYVKIGGVYRFKLGLLEQLLLDKPKAEQVKTPEVVEEEAPYQYVLDFDNDEEEDEQ